MAPDSSPPSVPPSSSADAFDAIVVGAGISGLATAFGLQRAGLRVQVIEAAERAGGVIATVARDGCLFERGPNSALDTTPLIGQLVQALGLQAQMRFASDASNKRYVVRQGQLQALPMSPGAFLSTPLFSAGAKLALLREPFVARSPAGAEESIAAFVRRRLGAEFLDYVIDPFVAGIYAGDPEQISVPAAFPKLYALEQRWGSLVRGQILGAAERKRAKETAKNTAKSFAFAGGMQVLTDALAAAVGPLALGTRATRIERGSKGVFTLHAEQQGRPVSWRARALILATPAEVSAALLASTRATPPRHWPPSTTHRWPPWPRPTPRATSRTRSTASAAWCRARRGGRCWACCSRAPCSKAAPRSAARCSLPSSAASASPSCRVCPRPTSPRWHTASMRRCWAHAHKPAGRW